MNEEDIEKISKYVASLDDKQLANLQQVVADGVQSAEKNMGRPLTESEVKAISVHEVAHEVAKAERTYNVAKDMVVNDILTKDEPKGEDMRKTHVFLKDEIEITLDNKHEDDFELLIGTLNETLSSMYGCRIAYDKTKSLTCPTCHHNKDKTTFYEFAIFVDEK